MCLFLILVPNKKTLINPRLELTVGEISFKSIKMCQGGVETLHVLLSTALIRPDRAHFPRTLTPPEIIRGYTHVLSSVIISFKCGALANPSILAGGPWTWPSSFVFSTPLFARPSIFPYYSMFLISPSLFLPALLPLNLRRHYVHLWSSRRSWESSASSSFFHYFFLLLLYNMLGVLPWPPPLPFAHSSTHRFLQLLARLRFPQDNR